MNFKITIASQDESFPLQLGEVTARIVPADPDLQDKTVTPTESTQTVTCDAPHDGLGTVTVNPIPPEYVIPDLQDKTVTPMETAQTVTADAGKTGLSSVTVNRIPEEYVIPSGAVTIDHNGVSDVAGYASADVHVSPVLQRKSITPTRAAQTVEPDSGKDGLSAVDVGGIPSEYVIPEGTVVLSSNGQHDVSGKAVADVSVTPSLQRKSVTPTRAAQTVEPDSGKDGLSAVDVGGIPSEYVIPTGTVTLSSNGQHDVSGKAVAAVDVQPVLQSKSVTPTRAAQTVTPDSGKDGLSAVDVGGIPSEYVIPTGTVTLSSNGQHDVSGFASAQVAVPGPSGQIEITENGEVDVAAFASALVNVAGGGGASNVVTGTFYFTAEGAQEIDIPYSGSGMPKVLAIWNESSVFNNIQYCVSCWVCQKETNTPSYDGSEYATRFYKYNGSSSSISYSYAGGSIKNVYKDEEATATSFSDIVHIRNNHTISLRIQKSAVSASNRGFASHTTYRYMIYYLE